MWHDGRSSGIGKIDTLFGPTKEKHTEPELISV
jgi:hypothetical protein